MSSITIDELRLFYSIDREIFTRLLVNLRRDAGQSMLAISLWLWLEEVGFPSIILKMLSLSNQVISVIAEEANIMLKFLETGRPLPMPSENMIQMTRSLMSPTLSFQFLYEKRLNALTSICKYLENVCIRTFEDILLQQSLEGSSSFQGIIRSSSSPSSSNLSTFTINNPIVRPAVIAPQMAIIQRSINQIGDSSASSSSRESILNSRVHPWDTNDDNVPQDERTMFMTFSRGYPLTEAEVVDYFSRNYGDCIEAFYMEEVPPNQQPLYARVIFRSTTTIATILDGKHSTQFVINGKHVRTRRWILYGR